MNRDLSEVVKSQQKMIGKDIDTLPIKLFESYKKQLKTVDNWKDKEPEVELIYVDYKNLINNPEEAIDNIIAFTGLELNKEKMIGSIDKSLYRNKA
jgi:hypothetical protein